MKLSFLKLENLGQKQKKKKNKIFEKPRKIRNN
jgi:hypothetical protein